MPKGALRAQELCFGHEHGLEDSPESWTKAFWWNMKNLNKNMNWREHEGKSNSIIPYEIVRTPPEKPMKAGRENHPAL
jgi:hypothetical protein